MLSVTLRNAIVVSSPRKTANDSYFLLSLYPRQSEFVNGRTSLLDKFNVCSNTRQPKIRLRQADTSAFVSFVSLLRFPQAVQNVVESLACFAFSPEPVRSYRILLSYPSVLWYIHYSIDALCMPPLRRGSCATAGCIGYTVCIYAHLLVY